MFIATEHLKMLNTLIQSIMEAILLVAVMYAWAKLQKYADDKKQESCTN